MRSGASRYQSRHERLEDRHRFLAGQRGRERRLHGDGTTVSLDGFRLLEVTRLESHGATVSNVRSAVECAGGVTRSQDDQAARLRSPHPR